MQKRGCPTCGSANSTGGVRLDKPCTLYYFKIDNVWKIGVTGKGLTGRYNTKDIAKMTDINTWEFLTGAEAVLYENRLILKYSKYKYEGISPFSDNTGTTECFTEDIHKLWKEENA